MPLEVQWPMPPAGRPSYAWKAASYVVVPLVGTAVKVFAKLCTKVRYHNVDILVEAAEKRPKGLPLLTASNHHSCIDDPYAWSMLPFRLLYNTSRMRWSLAAHDICFTCELHSKLFSRGQNIPVVRGEGVYQRAMDYCVELLNLGKWVHIYPEGRVNMNPSEFLRLKWGVGRLMTDSNVCPLVIPFWHMGMDSVLPNTKPYRPRCGHVVTINVGQPIDLSALKKKMESEGWSGTSKRKAFTDVIQEHFFTLREETQQLHRKHLCDLGRLPIAS
ncbi:tafazzin-like [Tropilaelaps mercedesae]|uniref:Tafazzin family protein n=1 Tax=Tropilaelaps mercedesae TaxID=418985 RepID=A0A1V9X6R4_9ACAR|nr:tafazzin-like [Tropilaelaps mercedesae]